jgi:hypothetical protein
MTQHRQRVILDLGTMFARLLVQDFFAGVAVKLQSGHEDKIFATYSRNSLTPGPRLG